MTLLGKTVQTPNRYCPDLLDPIERKTLRNSLQGGIRMHGGDRWVGYELSFLNKEGRPLSCIIEIVFPSDSPYILESKSLKLYLHSFAQETFSSFKELSDRIACDLSKASQSSVEISLMTPSEFLLSRKKLPDAHSIDDAACPFFNYTFGKKEITCGTLHVKELLATDLFKSCCPVTGQPDFATILIDYEGPSIDKSSLLAYLVSFRMKQAFHETCCERIFCDIATMCNPSKLSVYALYTRRGGLEINPFRTTDPSPPPLFRHARQ